MTEADLAEITRQCQTLLLSDARPGDDSSAEFLADWEATLDILDTVVPDLIAEVRRLRGAVVV